MYLQKKTNRTQQHNTLYKQQRNKNEQLIKTQKQTKQTEHSETTNNKQEEKILLNGKHIQTVKEQKKTEN